MRGAGALSGGEEGIQNASSLNTAGNPPCKTIRRSGSWRAFWAAEITAVGMWSHKMNARHQRRWRGISITPAGSVWAKLADFDCGDPDQGDSGGGGAHPRRGGKRMSPDGQDV
jgi:hypothetical protein